MPLHGRHRYFQRHLNGAIAMLFAGGSTLFLLGAILSLMPSFAARVSVTPAAVNAIFFAGSIPFTSAAYLQLFQAANVSRGDSAASAEAGRNWFGWFPGDIGWLGCAAQFGGTLLFNANTFDATLPGLSWLRQDLLIWAPDMIGSALFLVSGFFAFVEIARLGGAWQPRVLEWWITVINLLGCIAFMVSAVLAFSPAGGANAGFVALSTLFTAMGAAAFLAGSLMMLPEKGPG